MSKQRQGTMDAFLKKSTTAKSEPATPADKKPADTKARKLGEITGGAAAVEKADTKKKKVAEGAATAVDKEETKHSSTEAESHGSGGAGAAPILGGDCLASYENFIAELGSWQEPLGNYLKMPAFKQVYEFVKGEYKTQEIYPPKELIFNAFKHVPFEKLKVVIVGQDPYIKEGEAMGLCFSIPKNIKVPPSLKNIYKALENDAKVPFKMPAPIHGDLSKWAAQGVLLLNAILTVRKGLSNSHQKKGWEQFTDHVIQQINQKSDGVVFLLWGSKAQDKAKNLNTSKHLVLQGVHPSPLAGTGFPACKHFGECNEYLQKKGKTPIDWNV